MDLQLSANVQSIELSGIRKFYNKVAEVPDAISLTLGQPDFPVPSKVKSAMVQAIEQNKTVYTSNNGLLELRQEISVYLKKYGIQYSPGEICVTVGGSEGILAVFTAALNSKDKVLIPTIAYPAYESCVKLLGAEVVYYPLSPTDFSIDLETLKKLLDEEKPKAIVLSYPSNPTGDLLSRETRDALYELLKEREIIIITDEMYSALCFEEEYYSIAQCAVLKEKTILVSGFSKIFSMTGLRVGYVCAEERYMKQIMKVHQYCVSCAPSISQYGALEGLKSCEEDVIFMRNEFQTRRDYIYGRIQSIGLDVYLPKGAFYILPSIKKFGMSSEEFCERLLREGKVAVVPGSAFGPGGEGYIRISYAYSMEELKEGLDRFEGFIQKITQ